jgi:hypothetical protein
MGFAFTFNRIILVRMLMNTRIFLTISLAVLGMLAFSVLQLSATAAPTYATHDQGKGDEHRSAQAEEHFEEVHEDGTCEHAQEMSSDHAQCKVNNIPP